MAVKWNVKSAEVTKQRSVTIAAVAFGAVAGGLFMQLPVLALVAMGIFAPIIYEYTVGKSHEVSEVGATAGFSTITWDKVKSVKIEENAVQLSPFESESRLDATRGVRLVFDEAVDREQVMEIIRTHTGKDVRFLGG